MDPIKIGKFIAYHRKKKNLTQAQLGEYLKVSGKTISRWETGKYMPDISYLIPLSECLDISVHELLLGEMIEDKDMKAKTQETTKTIVEMNKKKRKKIESFYIIVILILALVCMYVSYNEGFSLHGNVENVNRVIETSNLYSEEEINDAMDVIIEDFERTFHGCTLKELRYSDIGYLSSSQSCGCIENYEKTIIIYSVFDVAEKGASSTLNAGSIYTQYQWGLAKINGIWKICNKGMG